MELTVQLVYSPQIMREVAKRDKKGLCHCGVFWRKHPAPHRRQSLTSGGLLGRLLSAYGLPFGRFMGRLLMGEGEEKHATEGLSLTEIPDWTS